jgi:hypothetical protein
MPKKIYRLPVLVYFMTYALFLNLFEVVSCSCRSSCSNTCRLVLSYFDTLNAKEFLKRKAFIVMVPVSFSEAVSYEVNQRIKLPQISLTTNADSLGKAGI